jgi:hypothetical protein
LVQDDMISNYALDTNKELSQWSTILKLKEDDVVLWSSCSIETNKLTTVHKRVQLCPSTPNNRTNRNTKFKINRYTKYQTDWYSKWRSSNQ